jgi:hypothetical protein
MKKDKNANKTMLKGIFSNDIVEKASRATYEDNSEERETENKQTSQELHKAEEGNKPHSPTLFAPSSVKKHREKKRNLEKVSCYLRHDQVEIWDELTDDIRMRLKKKKLEYKDIDRQTIIREIFDTLNPEQIEQLLTAKRSNSRAP